MTEGLDRIIDFWKNLNGSPSLEDYQHVLSLMLQHSMYLHAKECRFSLSVLDHVEELRKWLEKDIGLKSKIEKCRVSYHCGWEVVRYEDCLLVYWE